MEIRNTLYTGILSTLLLFERAENFFFLSRPPPPLHFSPSYFRPVLLFIFYFRFLVSCPYFVFKTLSPSPIIMEELWGVAKGEWDEEG